MTKGPPPNPLTLHRDIGPKGSLWTDPTNSRSVQMGLGEGTGIPRQVRSWRPFAGGDFDRYQQYTGASGEADMGTANCLWPRWAAGCGGDRRCASPRVRVDCRPL